MWFHLVLSNFTVFCCAEFGWLSDFLIEGSIHGCMKGFRSCTKYFHRFPKDSNLIRVKGWNSMKMSRCFISVMVQENIFSVNFPETAFVKIISMLSHTHTHTHRAT